MTREEAIKILGQYDVNFYWTSGEHEGEKIPASKLMDAFDTAIEALQQEPCEDCISRAEVLDLCDSKDPNYRISDLKEDVECLSSVTLIRPKGAWVSTDERYPEDRHCSCCGAIIEADEQDRHNWYYCYHCGADMKEGNE